jgi:hypothetical protein
MQQGREEMVVVEEAMHGNCASLPRPAKCWTSFCAILLASRLTGRWYMANAKGSPNQDGQIIVTIL